MDEIDQETASVVAKLPAKPVVVVIGSTSYWHRESLATCALIGDFLAGIQDLALITGGMTGIGEGVGRAFYQTRTRNHVEADVYHVLPRGCNAWDYGETLFAGSDMAERREILGRLSRLYLAIEGGPGTVHEAEVATFRGATVIPVGRSGGYAGEIYPTFRRPWFASREDWRTIGSLIARPDCVARAVQSLVAAFLGNSSRSAP